MKNKIFIGTVILIFLIGIIWSLFVLLSPSANTVEIVSDGKVLYTLDLSGEEDRTFVIPYGSSSNTVEIKDGKIRVAQAECPDKTCVHSGYLHSSAMPIVCLPNRLVIRFADDSGGVDAIAE